VRRALAALFGGAVGKDTVSRVWRKVKADWDAWNPRSLAAEPIIRLILDGTVVRVRLDKKATSISLLVALGVRQDGQKVLLAVKNMSGESEAAWRTLLDDLVKRGLKTPELVIVDGAPGLEKALAALWSEVPVQRCTVHKHRNLLAHAPDRLHDELSADYKDMIYAETKQEIEAKRKAFIRKWRLKCPAVAASLEEAGDKLFTFARFPKSQWKSIRTSNAIERLHEEFKRRIKTQTVLPSAETAAMLFGYPYGTICQLLILTDQRTGEIAALHWDWIDGDTITIHAAVAKNGRESRIPYGLLTKSILETVPKFGPLLFPARGHTEKPFQSFGVRKIALDKCGVENFTHHDLRRTYATNMAALGTPIHVVEKLLNHSSGAIRGVTAIYNRHAYVEEMKIAGAAYEEKSQSLLAG